MWDISYTFTDRSIQNVNSHFAKWAVFSGNFMRASSTYSLALIVTFIIQTCLSSRSALADTPQTPTTTSTTECAPGVPVRVPVTSDFQRVRSETPSVLCVFRHKTLGFPTLNVVEEVRVVGSEPPTLEEYQKGVSQGYRAVGLSEATLSNSVVGESHGLPFFTSEVTFSNKGTPMVAKILILQHHDKTYTASAIAEASSLEAGRALAFPLIDGIEVDGNLVRDTRHSVGVWSLIGVTCAMLFLAYVVFRSVRPRPRP
jgi:hypothetical protein